MTKSWKTWRDMGNGFRRRGYASYNEYMEKQAQKLNAKLGWCRWVDSECYKKLLIVLRTYQIIVPGMSVLCLGARLGGEVRAFREMGCFAVGIDLNPGEDNTYVLHGDFHAIQFADRTLDLVFSNSLDHVYDLKRLLAECHRVLKPTGTLHIEAKVGMDARPNKRMSDHWDCFEWASIKQLQSTIEGCGFQLERNYICRKQRSHPHGLLFRKAEP